MTDKSKIKYTFHNSEGEVVEMTFAIIEIEGMVGGFMKHVQEHLNEIGFGKPEEKYRRFIL